MARSIDARLLDLVGDVVAAQDPAELREALLVALDDAVPSEFVSINEVGPNPEDMQSVIRPAVPEWLHRTWAELGHENPLIQRYARTRDSRPYRFSDVITQAELHALALYRDFYAVLGVEYQIAFIIDVSPPLYVGVALSRGARDFTDSERTLLDRARPFLIQVYRNAIAYEQLRAQLTPPDPTAAQVERLLARGLSKREATVLGCVARGQSNKDIAAKLGVSERTIGKHLQRCYHKLGVQNRSSAAAIAWELAQS